MSYSFNPHRHVKIWLTSNPDMFMNFRNQTRLIKMREKNSKDSINLIYDSRLLNPGAHQELLTFCRENDLNPIDASTFKDTLIDDEASLYQYYEDEIFHLKDGGNLGVASDILRVLSRSFREGIYTDLDVPLDTTDLPETVEVESPFLLNVGSVHLLGNKETILALNELIIVADEKAAETQIKKLQKGILQKLTNYGSDYIDEVVSSLESDNCFNNLVIDSMKNRSEAAYIQKSTTINLPKTRQGANGEKTSRQLRGYINEIMSDSQKYLDFNRSSSTESDKQVIQHLKDELMQQLGFIKWFFFNSEYNEIKRVLSLNDNDFIQYMMKKERSLYIKSIVICTTGPMEFCRSVFDTYILSSKNIDKRVGPVAFSHYNLDKSFLSRNVVPLHENAWNMMKYLGTDVGVRNDSSWLEEGTSFRAEKEQTLLDKRSALRANLPLLLVSIKNNIEQQIENLNHESNGIFSWFINKERKAAKRDVLLYILKCFDQQTSEFNILEFKEINSKFEKIHSEVMAGYFSHRTRTIINGLEHLCHDIKVLRVTPGNVKEISYREKPSNIVITTDAKEEDATSPSKPTAVPNPGRYSIGMFGSKMPVHEQPLKSDRILINQI